MALGFVGSSVSAQTLNKEERVIWSGTVITHTPVHESEVALKTGDRVFLIQNNGTGGVEFRREQENDSKSMLTGPWIFTHRQNKPSGFIHKRAYTNIAYVFRESKKSMEEIVNLIPQDATHYKIYSEPKFLLTHLTGRELVAHSRTHRNTSYEKECTKSIEASFVYVFYEKVQEDKRFFGFAMRREIEGKTYEFMAEGQVEACLSFVFGNDVCAALTAARD